MILQGDPDLNAYLNELLRTNKTQATKQNFLVPDAWKSWQTGGPHPNTDRDPQRINRTQREKNTQPTRRHRFWINFLERLDWTNTPLTETEKQATEEFLVD